jgi:ATP-dependent exoDNAse (exonuclease V) beta subunit
VEQIDIIHSFCGMLLSAIHEEEGEEKLHLLMVDNHIPACAKLY